MVFKNVQAIKASLRLEKRPWCEHDTKPAQPQHTQAFPIVNAN